MKEFGMIRHGEKLQVGESRGSLESSGLSPEQQRKWSEAQSHLDLGDPEIAFRALPKIENMAREMFERLPDKAHVLFASTALPRARMTAELLSTELMALEMQYQKGIRIGFVWEPVQEKAKAESISQISMYPEEVVEHARRFVEREAADDEALGQYLGGDPDSPASRTHPMEDEIIFRITNEDLASKDSYLRRRAEILKDQVKRATEAFKDDGPLYFYGVGHHQSLIALDVAFNGRTHYDSIKGMPDPLALWHASIE